MKNIAFIGTEYQQNILFSICLQKNIEIEILFLREGVLLHKNVERYVHQVVYFKNIPFSWRSIYKYYNEYKKTIFPILSSKEKYRVFLWSLYNPLTRYTINFHDVKSIYWIDEGSASYANIWPYNYSSGWKDYLVSTFIFSATNIFSLCFKPITHSLIESWTLYENAYPNYNIEKYLIDHKYFQQVIQDILSNNTVLDIENESVVFITSAYVEYGVLSEEEFIQIMIETIEKIKHQQKKDLDTIYWKLHPRTNSEDEKIRLRMIQEATNTHFEILPNDVTMESIALANQEKDLQYYSLGSSSLYVIKALVPKETTVCLVENEYLNSKIVTQSDLNNVYKSISIDII